jgi:RimJ/RimL family protein N-acetyltransferase
MDIQPVTLAGRWVRLEPLSTLHVPDLAAVGLDDNIWKYMVYGQMNTEADLRAWVMDILGRQSEGTDLPFAVVYKENGQAIGATRYMNIDHANRCLEIGGTWYAPAYQRTMVNTECKYLLLRQAFEVYGCVRVQFKTDLRNVRSQKAIERLGAVKEGVLRNHKILPDGYIRHSVFYSILPEEWPQVKANLEEKLDMINSKLQG